jgi:heterodisulfide reductase subunit A
MESTLDGIFLAGCCQSPKDIPDSVAQACGAAAKAAALLVKGEIEIEPITAFLDDDLCCGCRICEQVCPYGAISVYGAEGDCSVRMRVDDITCKGCGVCASGCPTGAITVRHFKDEQIEAQIGALLGGIG